MPSGGYKRTKPAWNKGLKASEDERVAKNIEKSRSTLKSKYGVDNVSQIDSVKEHRKQNKQSIYTKVADTKQQRYGSSTYNNMQKNKETKLSRYGDENYNNSKQNKDTRINNNNGVYWSEKQKSKLSNSRINNHAQEKAKQTIIAKYGDLSSYYSMVSCKRYETMRKNGTLYNKETKPEQEYYKELLKSYSPEDIKRQYVDPIRYPFKCDFYIVPEDKFVEIHAFFTHGPHPYDKNNPQDVELAAQLEDEQTPWSKNILYTWTDLDVRKLETAKKNNLNFEAIYWYNR